MATTNNLKDFLTDVADAIREKEGSTGLINPQEFSAKIRAIETGGGGESGGGGTEPDVPVIGDGKTYLYIKIADKGRMDVPLYFQQSVANGVTIDWGDGSSTETLSGKGPVNTTHTYARKGNYAITLDVANGCTLGLGHASSSYCVMGSISGVGKVYSNMLQKAEIGSKVTTIGSYAFQYCYSLSSVVIPQSVTGLGSYIFQNCYSLSSVVIPQGVINISTYAFANCYSLSSVVIPQSVTDISKNAFQNCYSLSSVVIPQGVTTIGEYAFSNCYSLSSVVLPQVVTSFGGYVFQNCDTLSSVVIPQGVTTIGSYLLSSCDSLCSVVIPQSVTNISSNAFANCKGMVSYDFSSLDAIPTLSSTSAFSSIPLDCKIVVPDELYDAWIASSNWSTYASNIVKASEHTD